MSIDRFGVPIVIGWPSAHIIYLEVAMTLPRSERNQAFEDIASLTGRSLAGVQYKAYGLERERIARLVAPSRAVMVPAVPCQRPLRSELKPITKAQMMGWR